MLIGSLLAISLLASVYMTEQLSQSITQREANDIPYEAALKFHYHIAQVQQFATDASAIGNIAPLQDAKKHFDLGNMQLDTIEAALPSQQARVSKVRALYREFHAVGIRMANTYINEGRKAGNRLMQAPETGFDARADALLVEFDGMLAQLETVNNQLKSTLVTTGADSKVLLLFTSSLIFIVILIVLISMAGYFMRLLGGEPDYVRAVTERIADGDMHTAIDGSPPPGSMLAAIGRMQLNLRVNMQKLIRSEETLRLKENLFRSMFESMDEGVFMFQAVKEGHDFVFLDFNKAAGQIIQIPVENLLNRFISETFLVTAMPVALNDLQMVWRTGQSVTVAKTSYKNNNLERWLAYTITRMPGGEILVVLRDITNQINNELQVHYQAHHDQLTGLNSRYSLECLLEQTILNARREKYGVAVMLVDLDRFKTINDKYGHHAGDTLLIEVSRRIKGSVRESDIVARLGGDEFIVILTGSSMEQDTILIAHKILSTLNTPYQIDGLSLHCSASIGISISMTDGETVDELLRCADAAMYHAKEQGRNNFKFYNPNTAHLTASGPV